MIGYSSCWYLFEIVLIINLLINKTNFLQEKEIVMSDRKFLCPRTWFAIVNDYADLLDPKFVSLFKGGVVI